MIDLCPRYTTMVVAEAVQFPTFWRLSCFYGVEVYHVFLYYPRGWRLKGVPL